MIMFGVHQPPEGLTFDQMKKICLSAEEQGYDVFTITDHFYPMRPDGSGYPLECWSTLAGLAAVTRKIKLGSLVSCVYYRNPALIGKIATTVDIISNGRLILGIGAGWHESEFKAHFNRFPSAKERLDALESAAKIIRKMIHQGADTFFDKQHPMEGPVNLPLPIQTSIQLMIGGEGEKRTLRIMARYCDISHWGGDDVKLVGRRIEILKEHCRNVGRKFSDITLAVSITPTLEQNELSAQFIDSIKTCIELGVIIFTLRFFNLKEKAPEMQRRFAEEIMPKLKA